MEQIREHPYYQFFIGLPGYQDEEPFVPSLLVEFRKRLTDDILGDINEMIIAYNTGRCPAGGRFQQWRKCWRTHRKQRYPERILVDQIYRNRKNRACCKENGIRMSGLALGR